MLFCFGRATLGAVRWIVLLLTFSVFICGTFLPFQAFLACIVENYPRLLASAYASNGLVRALVGGAFLLFARQMFNRLALQGSCSLLGGLTALLFPITVVFYTYGAKLPRKSDSARFREDGRCGSGIISLFFDTGRTRSRLYCERGQASKMPWSLEIQIGSFCLNELIHLH